jgi:hypothetical protein
LKQDLDTQEKKSNSITIPSRFAPLLASLALTLNLQEDTESKESVLYKDKSVFRRKSRLELIHRAWTAQNDLFAELLLWYNKTAGSESSSMTMDDKAYVEALIRTIKNDYPILMSKSSGIIPLDFESPEHDIFTRVHQIVEGLLAVLMDLYDDLDSCPSLHTEQARELLYLACRCYNVYNCIIQQLSSMNVGYYAELRVSLRDASGSLSKRAQARKVRAVQLFSRYVQELKGQGYTIFLTLFPNASGAFEKYGDTTDAFRSLQESVQSSMKTHATMVQQTLGDTAIGTIGDQVLTLGSIASRVLFRDLDTALLQFTIFSALRHAARSGVAIESVDPVAARGDKKDKTTFCSKEQMCSIAECYFQSIKTHDIQGWLSCFDSKSCWMEDPVGTRPYNSISKLRTFFKNFMAAFPAVLEATHTVVSCDEATGKLVAQWEFHVETALECASLRMDNEDDDSDYDDDDFFTSPIDIIMKGEETLYFGDTGLVTKAAVSWITDQKDLSDTIIQKYMNQLGSSKNA